MKRMLPLAPLLVLTLFVASSVSAREETIPLTETRSLSITVPDGFTYNQGVNAAGEFGFTLVNAKAAVSLSVTFAPDPEAMFAEGRARRERMHEEFHGFVKGSAEEAMRFQELETKVGAASYCIFTDAKLRGKPAAEYPEGEYLNLTAGVKAWPGMVATFTLFSNDTNSPAYRTVMGVLRDSVHEKPAPLR